MQQEIRLNVNGSLHAVAIDPDTPLLYVLTNELALRAPRFGYSACTAAIVPGAWIRG